MAYPIRAPRLVSELLDMEDAAKALRNAGRMDEADAVEAMIRSASFDPESVGVSRMLRDLNPPVSREMPLARALSDLRSQELPIPSVDLVGDQDLQGVGRSYQNFIRGSRDNLGNQPVDLNRAARIGIAEAAAARAGDSSFIDPNPLTKEERLRQQAGEVIDRREIPVRAAMRSRLAPTDSAERAAVMAALAGATGLGGMIAETHSRMDGGGMATANAPELDYPELEQAGGPTMPEELEEQAPEWPTMPDVDLLPVDDPPIPSMATRPLTDEDMGLTDFSPMDTADLAAESRPIPDSTPEINIPAPKKPPMTAAQAAEHFSREAQAQISRLNQYRRSGLDRATERRMMAEIQHLHGLANEARRSASPLNYQR